MSTVCKGHTVTPMKRLFLYSLSIVCSLLVLSANQAIGQRGYPPEINDADVEVYKRVDGVDLQLWIKFPPSHKPEDSAPVILFFFGGGWRSGSPQQFDAHADWLAARGMVAVLVDYRVASRHGVVAKECVSDAKSAIRYVRQHAARLGIDPHRVVASGGSAGGHLAAAIATVPGFDASGDDSSISAVPNALALFNPAVVLAPVDGIMDGRGDRSAELAERMGTDPVKLSPYHNLSKGAPPTIIFHGTGDTTVPFATVAAFQKKMVELGNRCELVAYKGAGHGFFNFERDHNANFVDSMCRLDRFLISLGYLAAGPEVEVIK